ncbi:MAG TPA: hypothetical protein VIT63_01035 [Nitrospira sp.]|jgi:hypothetical protein
MLQSEREVVFDAQPAIDKQGIGFKGFIQSQFVRKVEENFSCKTGIRVKCMMPNYRITGDEPDEEWPPRSV